MSTQRPSNVVELPPATTDDFIVKRHGLGYHGLFAGRWMLRFNRIKASHDDLSGLLEVTDSGTSLFYGRFNATSLTTRNSTAKYLRERTDGFDGWAWILETFCRRVLALHDKGEPVASLTGTRVSGQDEWLLEPVLPLKAVTWLYGLPGASKSYLAAGIAIATATGHPFLGWTPRVGRVLILDYESEEGDWDDRIARLQDGMGVRVGEGMIHYSRQQVPLHDRAEELAALVTMLEVRLVIVDSFGVAAGSSDRGPIEESTTRLFSALRPFNCTTLVLDHIAKGDARNPDARPIGSQYKEALARASYELRAEEQPTTDGAMEVVMRRAKANRTRRGTVATYRISFGETVTIEPCVISAPDLQGRTGTLADQIARFLGESGAQTVAEIARAINKDYDVTSKTLRRHANRFTSLEQGYRARWGLRQ